LALPRITIDLSKIEHTKTLMSTLRPLGIELVGVVKASLGSPEVARAMLRGGASVIADSRLANLRRLDSLDVPLMMLRQPMRAEVDEVVSITDICLVSELQAVEWLDGAAREQGRRYRVVVMVETGDLREGVLREDLPRFMKEASRFDSVEPAGIGTNVACLQGVPPTSAMLERLVESAAYLREDLGLELPIISGGNSSVWKLLETGLVPSQVSQLRLGEAILLGQETVGYEPIPGLYQDAVRIEAEFIEVRDKPMPSPSGGIYRSRRGILALGSQDICRGELCPLDPGIHVLRRSSDHLVVETSSAGYWVGGHAAFIPGYEAMLAAMTSPFVEVSFF